MKRLDPLLTAIVLSVAWAGAAPAAWEEETTELWQAHIQPLFEARCMKCHGGTEKEAGLDLRTVESLLKGGESGPAVTPGESGESLLMTVIQPGSDPHMPPKGDPLSEQEIELLRHWIEGLGSGGGAGAAGSRETGEREPSRLFLPAGIRPELAIDFAIERRWVEAGIEPSRRSGDGAFARRIYLDLAGRIPALEELEAFERQKESDKRERLADALLESPEFAGHFAEIFNVVFLGREGDGRRDRAAREQEGWLAYLRRAFAENRSWDRIASDLIEGGGEEDARGAAWYLFERGNDHEEMARAVAPALFGLQVHCAQCHDHPVVPEIEQEHYWGLVSFFNRSFNLRTPEGPAVGEWAAGGNVQFSNLAGDSRDADLVFFTGARQPEDRVEKENDALERYVVAPPAELLGNQKDKGEETQGRRRRRGGEPQMDAAPAPRFSRRAALVQLGIAENPGFSRAIVNRIWALLMGRGLVHPVDEMDSVHPPSHPELLEWLGEEFSRAGYDLRWLIRAITASRAYQLDSAVEGLRPRPELFAAGPEKPLSAEAYSRSLLVACGAEPDGAGGLTGADAEALRTKFAELIPEIFPEVFSPTARQALYFTNSPEIDALLRMEGERSLLRRIMGEQGTEARVTALFRRILGREPALEEIQEAGRYLEGREDREEEGLRQLAWALLSGAEFRFNH